MTQEAVEFICRGAVITFIVFAAPRMQCLFCVVCFWDGLQSADKVALNKIQYFKAKTKFIFHFFI